MSTLRILGCRVLKTEGLRLRLELDSEEIEGTLLDTVTREGTAQHTSSLNKSKSHRRQQVKMPLSMDSASSCAALGKYDYCIRLYASTTYSTTVFAHERPDSYLLILYTFLTLQSSLSHTTARSSKPNSTLPMSQAAF